MHHHGTAGKLMFGQSDGTTGTSRKIFLTQTIDPYGNAVTLTYDGNLRIAGLTDAIGQVTTLSYRRHERPSTRLPASPIRSAASPASVTMSWAA